MLEPLQVGANVGRGLIPYLAIFLERLHDHRREPMLRRRRLFVEDVVENECGRRAWKRFRAGGQLEENSAERKDVAARVDGFAARLLRRHVRDRPDGRIAGGQAARNSRGVIADEFGEAEVEDLQVSELCDEKIRGLQIAV